MADTDLETPADDAPAGPRWAAREDARNRREHQLDEAEGRGMVAWTLGPVIVALVLAVVGVVWRWLS